MGMAGRGESWEAGGIAFSQPSVGASGVKADGTWDDGAILKAFDDALNTHTRRPVDGVEARKWEKYAAQEFAGVHSSQDNGVSPRRMENDFQASREQGGRAVDGGHGSFQQADSRFTALLAKGNGNAPAARGRGAGVPGPWEAVTMGAREGDTQGKGAPQHEADQRYNYARPGPYDYHRGDEYSARHYHPNGAAQSQPQLPLPTAAGGTATFEEVLNRHGLPPPQPPPPPGPHSAAFQSLDGVHDDELADLLLAWYYSGYYTGRYRAMQDARKHRSQRQYPPMPAAPMMPGHPTPPLGQYSEPWNRQQGGSGGAPPPATTAAVQPAAAPGTTQQPEGRSRAGTK